MAGVHRLAVGQHCCGVGDAERRTEVEGEHRQGGEPGESHRVGHPVAVHQPAVDQGAVARFEHEGRHPVLDCRLGHHLPIDPLGPVLSGRSLGHHEGKVVGGRRDHDPGGAVDYPSAHIAALDGESADNHRVCQIRQINLDDAGQGSPTAGGQDPSHRRHHRQGTFLVVGVGVGQHPGPVTG